MTALQRTPLYEKHLALGARMVPFAGFEMPVSYSGILEEHACVRQRVGMFDVSHMGEFLVTGPGVWDYLDRVVTNHCARLEDGGVLYTVMCRDDGTTVDDLLVARLAPERALVVVNAANLDKDLAHMRGMLPDSGVDLVDASAETALIAVQGPESRALLQACPALRPAREGLASMEYYHCLAFGAAGEEVVVSRTGYTGELGFEVFVPAGRAASLWDELAAHGGPYGLQPIGLAARDTLRFEASFCLYGHELDDDTTPLEAGLRWVVKFKKGPFRGRDALVAERERGSRRRLVGLELEGRNIARQGYAVTSGEEVVGRVTSGTFSPTLGKSLCMAFIDSDRLDADGVSVQVRTKHVPASRVELPFYPSRAR